MGMRNILIGVVIGVFLVAGGMYGRQLFREYVSKQAIVSPIGKILEKPLDKYTINALGERNYEGSEIVFDEATATTSAYTVYLFHFKSDNPTSSNGLRGASKKVAGVAHVPNGPKPANGFPVIVQLRGYVDHEIYFPGQGTQRSAEVFARNGFISLAPDFLGYGKSDKPSENVFEERFETYTTALQLLSSVRTIPVADSSRVGIWGHSNGGQIALTISEILHESHPVAIWAPVTKPFPYSILYFTDDIPDHGKALRKAVSDFEYDYNAELYSLPNYVDRILGPLQIHQGSADEAVPQKWSDDFVKLLKEKGNDVTYFTYPGADHNMVGSWDAVVQRDVEFFKKKLGIK